MIPDITLDHEPDEYLSFLIIALAYKTHDFSQALEKPREDPPAAVWALLIVKRDNRPVYERRGVALLHQSYVDRCMASRPCWETVLLG